MWRVAAVSVDDDLAAGNARIALRTAGNKSARGVNVILRVVIEQFRRNGVLDYFLLDFSTQLLVGDIRIVLRRDDNSLEPERTAITILNRNLRLAIRTEVRQLT